MIETGMRIFKESKKSFPKIKNIGVPNNNNPTQKIDLKIDRIVTMIISSKLNIFIFL